MNTYQKAGGLAALAHAFAYLAGIVMAVLWIFPVLERNPLGYFEFIKNNVFLMNSWILICYWGSAISVVVLALALYHLLKSRSSFLVEIGTVFGIIWAGLIIASANLMLNDFRVVADLYVKDPALTSTAWTILEAVEIGITSGNELIGSIWVMLLSIAVLRDGGLPRFMAISGICLAVIGSLTLVPALSQIPAIQFAFGLGMVIWSIALGIALLYGKPAAIEGKEVLQ